MTHEVVYSSLRVDESFMPGSQDVNLFIGPTEHRQSRPSLDFRVLGEYATAGLQGVLAPFEGETGAIAFGAPSHDRYAAKAVAHLRSPYGGGDITMVAFESGDGTGSSASYQLDVPAQLGPRDKDPERAEFFLSVGSFEEAHGKTKWWPHITALSQVILNTPDFHDKSPVTIRSKQYNSSADIVFKLNHAGNIVTRVSPYGWTYNGPADRKAIDAGQHPRLRGNPHAMVLRETLDPDFEPMDPQPRRVHIGAFLPVDLDSKLYETLGLLEETFTLRYHARSVRKSPFK